MKVWVFEDKTEMGVAAAEAAAKHLNAALAARGQANLILATGASQFEMLARLVELDVDWSRVTAFHLDEYIGLPEEHPASFRRYLKERFASKVPDLRQFHYVDGGASDPEEECRRLGKLISSTTVDLACIGIGENGHLAFNDPPADFETEAPYIVVELDEACRTQQLGEGWFPALADVPRQAISMSIQQIMKSRAIVCTVPDARKAVAVKNALEGAVTSMVPSSILQQHPSCGLFLDQDSAALLRPETLRD
jgi:glucosamine-6-phosphate deaminase